MQSGHSPPGRAIECREKSPNHQPVIRQDQQGEYSAVGADARVERGVHTAIAIQPGNEPPRQIVHAGESAGNHDPAVGLQPGSVNRDLEKMSLTFTLAGAKTELPVYYDGTVPENFTDDIEVVDETVEPSEPADSSSNDAPSTDDDLDVDDKGQVTLF